MTIGKHSDFIAVHGEDTVQLKTRARVEGAQLPVRRPAVKDDLAGAPGRGGNLGLDAVEEVRAEAAPLLARFEHQLLQEPVSGQGIVEAPAGEAGKGFTCDGLDEDAAEEARHLTGCALPVDAGYLTR